MRWVALLRAVNLGARNKVPMAELRTRLEAAGYGDVRTYVASGNVLLDGPRSAATLSAELESLIADAFGVAATVMLRKPRELAALVAAHPYGADTSETHIAFLAARPAKPAAARLEVPAPTLPCSPAQMSTSDCRGGFTAPASRVHASRGCSVCLPRFATGAP